MNDFHLGGWKVQFALMESMALTLRARHRGESDFGAWMMVMDPIDADTDIRPVVIGIGTYWAQAGREASAVGGEWSVGVHGAPGALMYRVQITTGPMRWVDPRFEVDIAKSTFEFDVAALEPLEADNADTTTTPTE